MYYTVFDKGIKAFMTVNVNNLLLPVNLFGMCDESRPNM